MVSLCISIKNEKRCMYPWFYDTVTHALIIFNIAAVNSTIQVTQSHGASGQSYEELISTVFARDAKGNKKIRSSKQQLTLLRELCMHQTPQVCILEWDDYNASLWCKIFILI